MARARTPAEGHPPKAPPRPRRSLAPSGSPAGPRAVGSPAGPPGRREPPGQEGKPSCVTARRAGQPGDGRRAAAARPRCPASSGVTPAPADTGGLRTPACSGGTGTPAGLAAPGSRRGLRSPRRDQESPPPPVAPAEKPAAELRGGRPQPHSVTAASHPARGPPAPPAPGHGPRAPGRVHPREGTRLPGRHVRVTGDSTLLASITECSPLCRNPPRDGSVPLLRRCPRPLPTRPNTRGRGTMRT